MFHGLRSRKEINFVFCKALERGVLNVRQAKVTRQNAKFTLYRPYCPLSTEGSKLNVTRFPYEITRLAEDIAGGLMVTAPSEKDLNHPDLKAYIEKYLQGASGTEAQSRLRLLRLIENITLGTAAVGYRTESMHGAGSPQAQRIMIGRLSGLEEKKSLAKKLAGITGTLPT